VGDVEVGVANPAGMDDEPGDVRPVLTRYAVGPGCVIERAKGGELVGGELFGEAFVLM
jgi:hypothetical protein